MKVVAVLSMLQEPAGGPDSASRRFRGEAPLAWALFRLGKCKHVDDCRILCWEDQSEGVAPIAGEMKCEVYSPSARTAIPHLDAISAARRWADGWRGGLFQTCEFDRGFHGTWVRDILIAAKADAVLLVDPSAALVDPDLVDSLIDHAGANSDTDLCFSQAAPGVSGVLLRKPLVEQLATGGSHPGTLLAYRPDLPMRDPIALPSCAAIPTALARTCHRFTLDSSRQIERISGATVHLNGQLRSTEAEQLLDLLNGVGEICQFPREIVVELTAHRVARPVYSPLAHGKVDRPDLAVATARDIFQQFAGADDARIVFGGVGDPLLHPQFAEIAQCAHDAGINAIAVETDLLQIDAAALERFADLAIDIVSIHFPAITPKTYHAMMGIDGFKPVMENLARLVHLRQCKSRGTPLVVPTFVKTPGNLGEMEGWYDHWLRTLGCAVITGPADFAGQIPDASLVQMEPPRRKACARIARRLTILSDGRMVACEQDFLGRHPLGRIGENSISDVWTGRMAALRCDHAAGQWNEHAMCRSCKDWHRP